MNFKSGASITASPQSLTIKIFFYMISWKTISVPPCHHGINRLYTWNFCVCRDTAAKVVIFWHVAKDFTHFFATYANLLITLSDFVPLYVDWPVGIGVGIVPILGRLQQSIQRWRYGLADVCLNMFARLFDGVKVLYVGLHVYHIAAAVVLAFSIVRQIPVPVALYLKVAFQRWIAFRY